MLVGDVWVERDLRAMNVNTLDEVPNSAWFVNRIGRDAMSIDDVVRRPDRFESISLDGWKVSGGKATGVQPGFRMTDRKGTRIRSNSPARQSGTGDGGGISARRSITRSDTTRWTSTRRTRPEPARHLRQGNVSRPARGWAKAAVHAQRRGQVLRRAAREPTQVSRAGQPLRRRQAVGQLSLLRHAARRSQRHRAARAPPELRAARVFGAWLNHDDSRGVNSLDMLVGEPNRRHIKHYMFDFGSIMGSGTVYAQRHRPGNSTSRVEARLADPGHAWDVCTPLDSHFVSRSAARRGSIRGRCVRADVVEA